MLIMRIIEYFRARYNTDMKSGAMGGADNISVLLVEKGVGQPVKGAAGMRALVPVAIDAAVSAHQEDPIDRVGGARGKATGAGIWNRVQGTQQADVGWELRRVFW